MAEAAKNISPLQRAQNFAKATRKNVQGVPSKTVAAGGTAEFTLAKTRLLESTSIMVEATLTVTHAAETAYVPAAFAPFTLLKRVALDLNNGFSPIKCDGKDLYLANLLENNAALVMDRKAAGRGPNQMPLVASAGGTANKVRFMVDLATVLNYRDPIGLILLQNEETICTITIDVADAAALAPAAAGFTFALSDVVITPVVDTFSVPLNDEARPDISILKLLHAQSQAVAGAGDFTVKFLTGNTYRKVIIYLTDAAGVGLTDDAISGNFEFSFNQADSPYKINPKVLAMRNAKQYGHELPQGVYVLDLSFQGVPNYGGSRDYIDTESLSEFWFTFNAPGAGTVRTITEVLTKLRD